MIPVLADFMPNYTYPDQGFTYLGVLIAVIVVAVGFRAIRTGQNIWRTLYSILFVLIGVGFALMVYDLMYSEYLILIYVGQNLIISGLIAVGFVYLSSKTAEIYRRLEP